MKKYTYVAIITPDEEGDYCVTFPDLKGCMTQGDDIADVYYMAHDASEGYLNVALEDGFRLPNPTELKDIKLKGNEYTMIVQVEV